MNNRQQSRHEWEQELRERQYNLTPAEKLRTSQYRASGLPKGSPLPISLNLTRRISGLCLIPLGLAVAALLPSPISTAIGVGLSAVGCYLIITALRWTAK